MDFLFLKIPSIGGTPFFPNLMGASNSETMLLMKMADFSSIYLGTGFLICALSLPLFFRKIPMNSFYGVRFAASYRSPEAWFAINHHGGKALLLAALPILGVGLFGRIFQNAWQDASITYASIGGAIVFSSLLTATVHSAVIARRIGRQLQG
ncbi:hypothetical protein HNR46_003527 [Haloferula luteola]|uniref:SdpI family protein n=1 Tax=Haloferula luteola TaxID=595692 RepID=A0A840V5M8_9BACT|nr:SdpI family protein [Haloferula luteola]MBB5353272.1 hypothetical protein [Haloferula luteola]